MATINININQNTHIALSDSRVQRILDGNLDAARQMGAWDRLKDVFRGGTKQAALNTLVDQLKASTGTDAVARFGQLSELLENKADLQALSVGVGARDHGGAAEVTFLVKGQPIQTLTIPQASVMAQLGRVAPRADLPVEAQANWLAGHRRDDADATAGITDAHFSAGGVHKKAAIVDGMASGALRADDATGRSDFANELGMLNHAQDGRPELGRYISTQRPLTTIPAALNPEGSYAVFDVYDPPVDAGELDKALTELSPQHARAALAQVVDMLRVFYQSDVSHRDLHMHNLMVYRNEGDPDCITLKAIDFGKSKFGEGVSKKMGLDDLRYMFNQTAIGTGDKIRRAYREAQPENLVSRGFHAAATALVGKNVESVQKHYPLHRLMAQVSAGAITHQPGDSPEVRKQARAAALAERVGQSDRFNELLANVGNQLIADLETAETQGDTNPAERTAMIDRAFERAAITLDDAAGRALAPPATNGLPTYAVAV